MLAGQVIVGFLFITSAVAKLRWSEDFRAAVRGYGITRGRRRIRAASAAITMTELLLGVSLVADWLQPWSALAGIAILIVFSLAVAIALLAGRRQVSCGCMLLGRNDLIGWYVCFRNLGLACLLLPSIVDGFMMPAMLSAAALIAFSFWSLDSDKAKALSARQVPIDGR